MSDERPSYPRLERMPVAELHPNSANPRTIDRAGLDSLRRSRETFGSLMPLVFNRRTSRLIGGHQNLKVIEEMGQAEAEVWCVDIPASLERGAMLQLNNHAGKWEDDKLSRLLASLRSDGMDMSLSGFSANALELYDRMQNVNGRSLPAKVSKADELQSKWNVKLGDIWALDNHRLLCGDALDPDSWQRLGGPFGLCIADPPYELTICITSFKIATQMHLVCIGQDSFFLGQPAKGFRNFFVHTFDSPDWVTYTHLPLLQHILIGWWCLGSRKGKQKMKLKGLHTHVCHSPRNQDELQAHQQAKPVEMIAPFIRYLTASGDEIADAFAGSGTTLMAAHELGRKSRSVEVVPENCAVILDRFERSTKIKPKREE